MQPNQRVQLKPLTGKIIASEGEKNGQPWYTCVFTVGGVQTVVSLPGNLIASS